MFSPNTKRVRDSSLNFTFCFFLYLYTSSCTSSSEQSNSCEVVFLGYVPFYVSYATVKCERKDNEPSLSSKSGLLKMDCELSNSTDSEQMITLSNVTKVLFGDCLLRPSLFKFLNLPNVDYFSSYGSNNYPVLLNNSFEGLCKCKKIWWTKNRLKSIQPAAFHCADSVELLGLDYNLIETLPYGVFQGMYNLTNLRLHYNNLRDIAPGVFEDLTSLRVLTLNHNSLTRLPEGLFRHQTSLEELWLQANRLQILPQDIFWNLPELRSLDLFGNRLTNLTNILSRNRKIKYLDVSLNDILVIDNGSFVGLPGLEFDGCSCKFLPQHDPEP